MRIESLSYLDPQTFWPQPQLDGVLLLIPSYRGIHPASLGFVNQCLALGAELTASWGCSDPALHRCIVASQAMQLLEREPNRYRSVVWLDDDMVATPSHVVALLDFAKDDIAVSGSYCKRGSANQLTWKAYPRESIVQRYVNSSTGIRTLYPITSGLGCLALSVPNFLRHCRSVPHFLHHGKSVPGICASGMSVDDAGNLGWRSEDQVYCESLWHYGVPVYGAPIRFGHISDLILQPNDDAQWLGDFCSFPDIDEPEPTLPNATDDV